MIMHFLTTGTKFPYAYYLGVTTAAKVHQGEVWLWYTQIPEGEYFKRIPKRVKKRKIIAVSDEFPVLIGKSEHFKCTTLFDYYIWRIIYQFGGIIMGLDSISLRDWQDLLPDHKEMLVAIDDKSCEKKQPKDWNFSMHGVIVRKDSRIAASICEDAEKVMRGEEPSGKIKSFQNGALRWGGAGIIPYINRSLENLDKIAVAPFGILGGINRDGKSFYIYRKDGELLHPDARTIPFYAASGQANFKQINEACIEHRDILLSKLVKKILTPDEWQLGVCSDKKPSVKRGQGVLTFHLLGMVHLPVSERYMACAFTQKIVKMAKMLLSLDHEVYLYGAEGSDAPCTEFIQTHTLKDIRDTWGSGDNRFELGYDWKKKNFRHDLNKPRTILTRKYYEECIEEINERKRPDDFLLLTQGVYQRTIAEGVKLWLTCEPGVGYRGSFAKFRAFESSYLQNFTYGSQHPGQSINGNYYDRVIPNYFDPKDFEFREKKDNYFLYIGRLIRRKGLTTAFLTSQELGIKLKIAGQGLKSWDGYRLVGDEITLEGKNIEYVGCVDAEERKELYSHAKATFVPTLYLEPFGGVAIESMLSGTPVITTDFGVFPETVKQGISGFRCNTLNDFIWAAKNIDRLEPRIVRAWAEQYLMDNVKWKYQRWFEDLYALYESAMDSRKKAWHRIDKNRKNIDWLIKYYPEQEK